jgi:hypothetical protein
LGPIGYFLPRFKDVPTHSAGLLAQAEEVEGLREILLPGEEQGAEARVRERLEPILGRDQALCAPKFSAVESSRLKQWIHDCTAYAQAISGTSLFSPRLRVNLALYQFVEEHGNDHSHGGFIALVNLAVQSLKQSPENLSTKVIFFRPPATRTQVDVLGWKNRA